MPGDPFHDDVWLLLAVPFHKQRRFNRILWLFLKERRCLKKGSGSRIISQVKAHSCFSEEPLKSSDHIRYSFFQILRPPNPDKPTRRKEVLSNYQTHTEREKIASKGKNSKQNTSVYSGCTTPSEIQDNIETTREEGQRNSSSPDPQCKRLSRQLKRLPLCTRTPTRSHFLCLLNNISAQFSCQKESV